MEIRLDNIDSLRECDTLGVVPNGLSVILKSGVEYRFVLSDREGIMRVISPYLVPAS